MMVFLAVRADFGFGNPNLAAALFAMLAVGVWGIPIGRKTGRSALFLGRLVVSAGFTILIVLTASRGGLVALAAGGFVLWAASGFLRPRSWQGLALAGVLVLLIAFSALGRMGERVAESSPEDGSITSRLAIFRAVPALLASAPWGWGVGESAEAYQNWFQAPEDMRTYKHLLFEQPYDLMWLNPPARLDAASRQVVEQAENAVIVWGGLRTDGHPRELKKWFTALPEADWREVPGSGLLLESWD